MSIKELRVIAVEMGIPAIKKAIHKESDKLHAAGHKDIANAIDQVLKLC
ncbi:hypothetical protein N9X63_05850 [Woeseiaceae bacterium]|mgnify:FL=1|jgi:hypothetical protein|nr:hypothetical protein [Woeseiaceae bacterium]